MDNATCDCLWVPHLPDSVDQAGLLPQRSSIACVVLYLGGSRALQKFLGLWHLDYGFPEPFTYKKCSIYKLQLEHREV